MSTQIKRTRLLITLLVSLFLIGGTFLAIQLAKGYRPNLGELSLSGTGLLSTTSYPKSAQVFINDRLTTVTDDTLNLSPGDYQVKIIKTGFHPWTKAFPINPELVSTTDARLFPAIPSLTPLTFYQVRSPLLSPDGSKLIYTLTNSPFNQDDGLYVLSLSTNFLAGNQITQIADLSTLDYTKAELLWSPDGSQILAVFHDGTKVVASHLLNSRSLNLARNLTDTTFRLPALLTTWQEQLASINKTNLARLPQFLSDIASQSAVNVYFSPDREKLLYTTTSDITLPENLTDRVPPSINPAPQQHQLTAGKTYIYDLKEDSNFLISEARHDPQTAVPFVTNGMLYQPPTPTPTKNKPTSPSELTKIRNQIHLLRGQYDPYTTQNLSWYSSNRHLVITTESGVAITEYDGNNLTPIVSAQIANGFAASSPDGTHLIILTNLNQKPDAFNLISIDLK